MTAILWIVTGAVALAVLAYVAALIYAAVRVGQDIWRRREDI